MWKELGGFHTGLVNNGCLSWKFCRPVLDFKYEFMKGIDDIQYNGKYRSILKILNSGWTAS